MLITHLCEALPTESPSLRPPLGGSSAVVRQKLLLTLLFLGAVGVPRTWDLRGYTGDGLALLTGRMRAYGYRYTEAFLSQVAHAGGAQSLTQALARWTTHVWHASDETTQMSRTLTCYIDGHRKPVYTDALIPRGLVGRLSTIRGLPRFGSASRCRGPSAACDDAPWGSAFDRGVTCHHHTL